MSSTGISAPPGPMLITIHQNHVWHEIRQVYFIICLLPDRLSESHSHINVTVCFRNQSVFQLIWLLHVARSAGGCSNRKRHHGALRLIFP